jgi:hypothetical protein
LVREGLQEREQYPKQPAYMPEIWVDVRAGGEAPEVKSCWANSGSHHRPQKKMRLNIIWVTFDQFQSSDSQQILRQQGLITGHQSMDEVPCRPCDFCKTLAYEGS